MQNNEQLQHKRHTLAHLTAASVRALWPGSQNAIGPAIENGFYYDFDNLKITDQDLPKIEKKMREILPSWKEFIKSDINDEEAKKLFADNPYKLELIDEYAKDGLTTYTSGNFTDLCRGGHSLDIDPSAFKLTHVAGAYWRGSEKNQMLTRIYGLYFDTKKELDDYLTMLEEAKRRDHKVLGPKLDLFVFSDLVGAGLPLFTPKGTFVFNALDAFVWELRKKRGYDQVDIPHITKKELYETSGHWDKYKDDLFKIQTREGHTFAMKPMNCPHHTQIYARKQWSYRELPQRYASTTKVYRDEQSGELAGLSRVRSITQDDAHVFCRISQAKDEIQKIWDVVHEFYGAFGLSMHLRLSLRDPEHPEKYLGNQEHWNKAETILREVAQQNKTDYVEAIGEAAFYAPKLDFLAHDSIGREWQVATIQLDVNMPERFDLFCVNEQGEHERIVMIHAAIMGAIERLLSVLIEHFAGAFPLWLAPVQIAVLPISEKHAQEAGKITKYLQNLGLRAELHDQNESIGKKIRNAEMMKIPYLAILGDKEIEAKKIAVRKRGGEDLGQLEPDSWITTLKQEIDTKSL